MRDAEDESIASYFARLSRVVKNDPVQGIVLVIRFNGGGDDYLNLPVVEWLKSALPVIRGRFYVYIGRGTYSAAQKLIVRLEATTDVILVGEPTGGNPNYFGEVLKLQLPKSGLTLEVFTLSHEDAPGDTRRAIVPDILASFSAEDYISGRDPALQAMLSARMASC